MALSAAKASREGQPPGPMAVKQGTLFQACLRFYGLSCLPSLAASDGLALQHAASVLPFPLRTRC